MTQTRQDAEDLKLRYMKIKEPTAMLWMNIAIMVIGSRDSIQPFLKIGQILRDNYGHRVPIATYPAFRKFVRDETDLKYSR